MIIYKTINNLNNKIYVGKHNTSADDGYLGSGTILKKALNKYGKDNFTREIIEFVNESNWATREIFWINNLSATTTEIGYNILSGGDSGPIRCGKDNGMYGKSHSEETMKIIKEKASMWAQNNKDKCAYNKGRIFPQSVRDNMSIARMGSNNPAAKKIKYNNIIYQTIKEAHIKTGHSKHKIRIFMEVL